MSGRVALITGSSSGIGAAVAVHFASLGYKISLTGRNIEGLNSTRADCIAKGLAEKDVLITVAELSSLEQIEMLVKKTIEAFGKLHVLVNNAGNISGYKPFDDVTDPEFEQLIDLNLRAPFRLIKFARPHLLESKGNIINVSSSAGQIVIPAIHAYGVCKAALDHMTRGLAVELAPAGVRVNAVSPGCTETPVYAKHGFPLDSAIEAFSAKIPMKRFATAEEMAKAIAFLADEETASYITGVILPVDGALSLNF